MCQCGPVCTWKISVPCFCPHPPSTLGSMCLFGCWFQGAAPSATNLYFFFLGVFFLEAAVSPGKCFFFNSQLNMRYAQNNFLSKPSRLLGSRELGALFLTPRTPQETRQLPRTPQGATELAQAVNQRCPNVAQARPTPLPNISLIRILTGQSVP